MDYAKIYKGESLRGAIRYRLTPPQRCTWYDLLILAQECDQAGRLADEWGKPLSRTYIARIFNVHHGLLARTIKECVTLGLLRDDKETGISILVWNKYRSEYGRQQASREIKSISFEDYRDSLREKFRDLDFDYALEKFELYYGDLPKPPVNKKLALRRWMENERQEDGSAQARRAPTRGDEQTGGENGRQTGRGIPGNEPAGAFDDIET